jgi:hypothetical protein
VAHDSSSPHSVEEDARVARALQAVWDAEAASERAVAAA